MQILIESFVWFWLLIIGSIPGIFMSGLSLCIGATLLTYLEKRKPGDS